MAYMTNTNAENFGTVAGGSNVVVSHASLILNFGETGVLLLWTGTLAATRTYVQGDPIELPAGALDINWPNGALQDAAVLEAIDDLIAAKAHGATLHLGTGAMGAAGTTNEVADSGYLTGNGRPTIELTTALGTAP